MNKTEAVLLLRKVSAYRPAQYVDDFTGEAWAEALADVRLEEASEAVRTIGRMSSDFIAPADVRDEARRIRAARIADGAAQLEPPPWEGQKHYQEWLAQAHRRLGDGETVQAINADTKSRGQLKPRNMAALPTAGRKV